MVINDLSRFVDQYFYTLKKYSFNKHKTKIKVKGMEWFRLIGNIERKIKKDEGIGQKSKMHHQYHNGNTIDGKAEQPKKELSNA